MDMEAISLGGSFSADREGINNNIYVGTTLLFK
jgi:hypothetical protein